MHNLSAHHKPTESETLELEVSKCLCNKPWVIMMYIEDLQTELENPPKEEEKLRNLRYKTRREHTVFIKVRCVGGGDVQ